MSPAAQAARTIRARLKSQGYDSRGLVRIVDNPGISTAIQIDASRLSDNALDAALHSVPESDQYQIDVL